MDLPGAAPIFYAMTIDRAVAVVEAVQRHVAAPAGRDLVDARVTREEVSELGSVAQPHMLLDVEWCGRCSCAMDGMSCWRCLDVS